MPASATPRAGAIAGLSSSAGLAKQVCTTLQVALSLASRGHEPGPESQSWLALPNPVRRVQI